MSLHEKAEELFTLWLDMRARGEEVSPDLLCTDQPDLLPILKEKIESTVRRSPGPAQDRHAEGSTISASAPHGDADVSGLPRLPWQFRKYLIEEVLGRGGMGVVYRAFDAQLTRYVALKMVRCDIEALNLRNRFEREARAIAQLKHPGIVQLLEFGEAEGNLYFTMDLLENGTLRDHVKELAADQKRVAAIMEAIALAVDHAHRHGIIHRDLKPSNILLNAAGQPCVSDFGLAKWVDGSGETLTASNQFLGTAAYMSPEQVSTSDTKLDGRADIWSLGVMLYELLGGRRPFVAESSIKLLPKILTEDPPSLHKLNPKIDKGLETIALKCLEKDPARRYKTAAELAADLGRWQRGESLQARPLSLPGKMARSIRKRPGLWAGSVAVVVVALAAALVPWSALGDPDPQVIIAREKARKARLEEEAKEASLKDIQQRLGRGEKVELVSKGKLPSWYRWVSPGVMEQGPNGECILRSFNEILLELLPAPNCDHYRLEADLQYAANPAMESFLGIYVGAHIEPEPAGPFYFASLTYDDQDQRPDGQALGAQAAFHLYMRPSGILRSCLLKRFSYSAPSVPRPVHRLALELGAEQVKVLFDNEAPKTITQNNLQMATQFQLIDKNQPPAVLPVFGPRQAVGIHLRAISAAVHSVSITPLDPKKSN
jgi:serine/threonine protein kinase